VQHSNNLYSITFYAVWDDIRGSGYDQLPGFGHPAWTAQAWGHRQPFYRLSDTDDDTYRLCRIVFGNSFSNVLNSSEEPTRVFDAPLRHRGLSSRSYRAPASSCETMSPASSSAMPVSISSM
jgi:hypothetical protein